MCYSAGRYDDLRVVAKEALRHNADDASLHYNIGSALGKAADYAAGERHFLEAVRLQPSAAAYHANLGQSVGGCIRTPRPRLSSSLLSCLCSYENVQFTISLECLLAMLIVGFVFCLWDLYTRHVLCYAIDVLHA